MRQCVRSIGIWMILLAGSSAHVHALPPPFVYIALGASDAMSVGADSLSAGYVYLIRQELERLMPHVTLINRGVSGARIDMIHEEVLRITEARHRADLVTLWVGANDLVHGDDPQVFQKSLRVILQTLREHVSHTIVIGNLPDLTRLPRFRRQPSPHVTAERIEAYNAVIAAEARDVDAALVDLFAQRLRDDLVFHADGFHPNEAGHREIAALFLSAIRGKITASISVPLHCGLMPPTVAHFQHGRAQNGPGLWGTDCRHRDTHPAVNSHIRRDRPCRCESDDVGITM